MEDHFRSSVCIPGAVFVVLFSLLAVVLNILLLIVLYKDPTKSLRSTTALYVASLAVLHLLFGSVVGTAAVESYVACALDAEGTPHFQSQFSRISFTLLIRAENFIILAFSVERLGNTAFPVFYPRADKVKNTLICFACIAFYALSFSIFEILAGKWWIRRLDVHLNVVIPLAATIALTAFLYKAIRKLNDLRAEHDRHNSALQRKSSRTTRIEKQILLSNAFIFVALLFTISLVPYFILALNEVYCENCAEQEWFFAAFRTCVAFTFLNAGLTPFIYYVRVPEFQKGFKMVFCGMHEEQPFSLKPFSRNNNASGKVPVIYL